jgi:hypothetical protein
VMFASALRGPSICLTILLDPVASLSQADCGIVNTQHSLGIFCSLYNPSLSALKFPSVSMLLPFAEVLLLFTEFVTAQRLEASTKVRRYILLLIL